ncbi:MAG: apolipoprotein N-acyltransferase [Bacteroidales bacterium]|nr:apolipoprotein N-acyltransferase [Bacteroidales bacterium]
MKKIYLILLSILSGILFWLAWPVNGLAPLLFVSFIPLLFVEHFISENKEKYNWWNMFSYSYLTFLTWNLLTTWWICYASFAGAALAFIFNSLFMAVVFTVFHVTKKRLGNIQGYIAFVFYWVAFEYLHTEWELSWPWLTLGNGFASNVNLVQWYEFTGVFGGSLWVVVTNILFFIILKKIIIDKKKIKEITVRFLIAAVVVIAPVTISNIIYNNYTEKGNIASVVIVQPNIDPYNEKFGGMAYDEQLKKLLSLAKTKIDTNTDFLVAPETAIAEGIWENEIDNYESIITLKSFFKQYPGLNTLIGISSYKHYVRGEKLPNTARKMNEEEYYDAYNTAMFIDNKENIRLYHKSKLVIGVEKIPFPALFKPFEKFAINLGGTTGSLGLQKERTVFKTDDGNFRIAPAICYESIYGNFISKYVANGANLIFIITNDGWWKDTPGYRQHCAYARLRTIECRRSIARAANTGISCFINQKGDVQQPTKWWTPAVIKQNILANNEITFYVKHGDYIAKFSSVVSCLILLLLIFIIVRIKLFKKGNFIN